MKSKIIKGTAIALFAASMIMPGGLPAQEPEQLAPGTTFKTLAVFEGLNGEQPYASPVQGPDGNLYGTAVGGGAYYQGTVFKMTPRGTLTALYSFCSQSGCPDGNAPETALVLGTDGKFYGTTYAGGANVCRDGGCGTFFSITPAGALTTLYSFCAKAGCADGAGPGALVQGRDGNFYGTTQRGGSGSCANTCGTVFKITPTGVLTSLYSFTGNAKYPVPTEGLVQATDGNFYGTTPTGGVPCSYDQYGCGTVYKITPQGVLTVLHSFTGTGAEGFGPSGTIIQATDGNFYGTTGGGGTGTGCNFNECGTVYKMTPQGTFTTLADFNTNDGAVPIGVIQATDGNFYGVSEYGGGGCNCGAIFEVTPEGVVTPLHDFTLTSGGSIPVSGLLQATNGGFYGTTMASASGEGPSYGVVYSMSVGLGPFIKFVPVTGKIGATIKILGNGLTGATSVTFNGTAATFTVVSATEISTTVPAGATTGPVEVTLPSGTLLSNGNFQVLP